MKLKGFILIELIRAKKTTKIFIYFSYTHKNIIINLEINRKKVKNMLSYCPKLPKEVEFLKKGEILELKKTSE